MALDGSQPRSQSATESVKIVGERLSLSVSGLGSIVASLCCEKLAVKARRSSGTQGKGTSAVGGQYRATICEDMTVDSSLCVIVHCKV